MTIFAAISSADLYFASFVYPLRLVISLTNVAFVDCIRLLIDRLGEFVRFSHSQIWTQAQIRQIRISSLPSSGTVFAVELPANLNADIWHGSIFTGFFPLLRRVFFPRSITRLFCMNILTRFCSRPVQRLLPNLFLYPLISFFQKLLRGQRLQ